MSTTPQLGDGIAPGASVVTPGGISEAEIHEVLSNERRILLLRLLNEESPRDLRSLAEAIAAAETGEDPPPRNIRQSVYVTLHQSHLPKLDDLGIVEYDARDKVVALASGASMIFDEDSEAGEGTSTGVEPFLALVLAGLATSGASAVGVPPFSSLSVAAFSVATLLALLVGFAYRLGREGSSFGERLGEKLS